MDQKLKQDRSIGGNIRALRLKKGWTQEQTAAKLQLLGINGQSAYRILRKLTQAGRLLREGDKRSSIYRACAKPCTP